MNKAIIAAAAVLALNGCATRIGAFTVASTKNLPLDGKQYEVSRERVSGDDTKHVIVLFPTGVPNAQEAMDRAIESTPGAVALNDVTVTQVHWYIPLIYGQTAYEVEGNPVIEKPVSTK